MRVKTLLTLFALITLASAVFAQPKVTVEVEEDVITVPSYNNGAGPFWCYGSSLLVRSGERVFVSVNVPGENVPRLCNTRPRIYERKVEGWEVIYEAEQYREREPCPLIRIQDSLILSTNPSNQPPGTEYGPCVPTVRIFDMDSATQKPSEELPAWIGEPKFTDHSYRGIAADSGAGELILFHIDAESSEQNWSYRNADGEWSKQGKINFPIRACYPQVGLKDRGAHIMAIGDIVEPNAEWQQYKFEKTGSKWDYVFRRLFYSYNPNILEDSFNQPLEIDSVDDTAGYIRNLDMYIKDSRTAYLLYTKQPVQSAFMRDRFFPDQKLTTSLEFVEVTAGKITDRKTLFRGGEGVDGVVTNYARFHATPDGSLYILTHVTLNDGSGKQENRIQKIAPEPDYPATLPLKNSFSIFFTANQSGGSVPSNIVDIYGSGGGSPALRYARITLE